MHLKKKRFIPSKIIYYLKSNVATASMVHFHVKSSLAIDWVLGVVSYGKEQWL
jgi:hypothetical protein